MSRDTNITEKIWLMSILAEGIENLSTEKSVEEEDTQEFYFKKVKSKYLKEGK